MDAETNVLAADSSSTSTTWLLIYSAVALCIIHQFYSLSYFWRKGIPGPRPYPLVGNTIECINGPVPAFRAWKKKYGDMYGIFMGLSANLVTTDVDFTRRVLIKDFNHFADKQDITFKMKYLSDTVVGQDGAEWKRSRAFTSPAFSGSKMKQMIPGINKCCDDLLDVIKEKDGKDFEVYSTFGAYSLDCVACCGFGIEGNCQKDPDGPFMTNAKKMTLNNVSSVKIMFMYVCGFLAPIFNYFDVQFDVLAADAMIYFAGIVKQVMQLREEGDGNQRKDFLQLMMDAAEGDEGEEDPSKDDKKDHQETKALTKKTPLTAREVTGQGVIFFLAGYDTVSGSMAYVAYALATYPEVQETLLAEIDEMVPKDEPISYDLAFKLEYLEKVWSECLRMWPFQFALNRKCAKDFVYKDMVIHKGSSVYIDTFSIHRDARYWDEPDTFNPERFTKEAKLTRHPCAFMPFGAGPRNCVGMRFAVLEIKIGLIRILQKYKFEKTPETVDLSDLSSFEAQRLYPTKGIHVRLVPRT